jgi:hypothetical protein
MPQRTVADVLAEMAELPKSLKAAAEHLTEKAHIRQGANRKRSEAQVGIPKEEMKERARTECSRTSDTPERKAKAAASKTNPGAVARGDKIAKERPDLAEDVRLGKMKPAHALSPDQFLGEMWISPFLPKYLLPYPAMSPWHPATLPGALLRFHLDLAETRRGQVREGCRLNTLDFVVADLSDTGLDEPWRNITDRQW